MSYMLPSVWGSYWAEKGRKCPWDIHPVMASGLDNPLASRSLSGEKGAFGPLAQLPGAVKMKLGHIENSSSSTKCIWVSRSQGIWEGSIDLGLEDPQFSHSVMSDSLQPHELQHARPPWLLEFPQTHVHRVGDAIQPSHPLSSPSPPAPNLSQHESLFQ